MTITNSEENIQKSFLLWECCPLLSLCQNLTVSCWATWKSLQASLCPQLLSVHLSPNMFSALDFCAKESCQASSCPCLFSSCDPYLLSLSPLVFELPPLWTAAFICSCFGLGESSANENKETKKTRRVASALHVWQLSGCPLLGLLVLWVGG